MTARNSLADIEVEATQGVTIHIHECTKPKGDWSPAEILGSHGLVIVRRGGFRRRLDADDDFIGPSLAFFEGAGAELQIKHPHEGGDTTTMFWFTEDAALRLTADAQFPTRPILTEGWVDLLHRVLTSDLRNGVDYFEAEDRVAQLVGMLIEGAAPGRVTTSRSSTEHGHRRVVDIVREAVASDPARANLPHVAGLTGRSVFHVSRIFRRQTGMSLSRFRNSVRAALAIERLDQGEDDLAGLALGLGFTDQSHMTHVIRKHVGTPPGRIRQILQSRPKHA